MSVNSHPQRPLSLAPMKKKLLLADLPLDVLLRVLCCNPPDIQNLSVVTYVHYGSLRG